MLVVTAVALRLEGRDWFCECGELRFWISSPRSSHTSQHLFDPYTFTHIQHGIVFFWAVFWLLPRLNWHWKVWLAMFVECAWEVLENSPPVIERYRNATAALGYTGDTVVNGVGDAVACLAGILIASKLPWRFSLAIFLITEIALLITIRDSLLLNVLMLVVDVEWLKQWQAGASRP